MIYDKLYVALLTTLAAEDNDSLNKTIAAYILAHPEDVMMMSIKELAAQIPAGVGSLSRFCVDVGLSGYSELKSLLKAHQTEGDQDTLTLEGMVQHIQSGLNDVLQSLDLSRIIKLCQDIKAHEKVSAYGMLKAAAAAIDLQVDLYTMGKSINTAYALSAQIDHLKDIGSDELLIIFSYTGSYFNELDLRKHQLNLYAPKIYMITGDDASVPDFVDEVIVFKSDHDRVEHPYQLEMVASVIAHIYKQINQI